MALTPKPIPFNLRIDADEKAAFIEAARLKGLSTAGWVRMKLREAAQIELRAADKEVPWK